MRSARFEKGMDEAMRRLNASIGFDWRLHREDIAGSKAWAEGLEKLGLLTRSEMRTIQEGLDQVAAEIESGDFEFREDLEDIHMNVEARLTALIGDTGARLHTGRSRNDQVATDLRLFVKRSARQSAHRRACHQGRGDDRRRHPGLHALAACSAGALRASSPRVRRDVRT